MAAVEDEDLQAELKISLHNRIWQDSHTKERGQVGAFDFSEHETLSETLEAVSVKSTITRQGQG